MVTCLRPEFELKREELLFGPGTASCSTTIRNMGRRSRLHQQRLNSLAQVKNPGRKKRHPQAKDYHIPPTFDNSLSQDTATPLENMHSLPKDLEERGLWRQDLRAHCKIDNPKPTAKTKHVDNPSCLRPTDGRQCCARAILSSQPDFAAQKSCLEEVIENAGHLVLFYPKLHCEMNWVEYYWGSCKRYARKHCTYTLAGLYEVLPGALESVPDTLVWKYWNRTQRIINVCTLSCDT